MDDSILDRILDVSIAGPANPWRNDYANASEHIVNGKIILHNNIIYEFGDNIQWDYHWKINDRSNRMWLMSLHFVGELLTSYTITKRRDHLDCAKNILRSFLKEFELNSPKIALQSSSDHAYYVRTCVLVKAIQTLKKETGEREFCKQIVDALIQHMLWMYDDSNHLMNNHGAMVDFGLIIGSVQLSPMAPESLMWRDKACERLTKLLDTTFDEDGMNNENTVGYQVLILTP